MIRSFGDKETERLFDRERVKKFALPLQRVALRKLLLLDAAERVPCRHANCRPFTRAKSCLKSS